MSTTITALPAASALAGTEVTAVDQSGTTKKATMNQIKTFIGASPLAVDDGTTTVSSVTAIHFSSGATVSSGGAGIADVAVSGGGGGGGGVTFSGCSVRQSADQSMTGGAQTTLLFDTEDYDTDGYHSTSSNTSRLTAAFTGYYIATASSRPSDAAPGSIYYILTKNGSTTLLAPSVATTGLAQGGGVSIVWEGHLNAGDYLETSWYVPGGTVHTDHTATIFTLSLRALTGAKVSAASTVAGLPGSPAQGDRAFVTDATATTFLSTVVGGGSDKVPVVYDGTNWVIG